MAGEASSKVSLGSGTVAASRLLSGTPFGGGEEIAALHHAVYYVTLLALRDRKEAKYKFALDWLQQALAFCERDAQQGFNPFRADLRVKTLLNIAAV